MKKFKGLLAAAAVALGVLAPLAAPDLPTASACPGAMSFGVGGFYDPSASVFTGRVDVRVQYSGWLNDIEGGVNALTRDVNAFRAHCPGSQLILTGHSQGAAIVHVYASRNQHWLPDVPAAVVLFSDPKQLGTGQSDGLFAVAGYPIAGTDANFGNVNVTSVCHIPDGICNRASGWHGYLFTRAHVNYNFDPYYYAWWNTQVWY